ncbi:hypothetical protein Shel_15920 [Slackia heliotrinireducens DSM 20476]|uniref:Helix-turn-helix domain-containing protein n=2 Tax=Slackia TaxID=84108 RepID=C7N6S6_SLAHD|nr:hypothetical protein Shel_15920 [Slackia heliotrinireducens DSM 20476]
MFMTVRELAEQWGCDIHTVYALARDKGLPLRYLPGHSRGGAVLSEDLADWWRDNAVPYSERKNVAR